MDEKSKSQCKREAAAWQHTIVEIAKLPNRLRQQIPLPENINLAITEYLSLKSHGAKHRQAQYLGKLMRKVDVEPILLAYEHIKHQQLQLNQHHKQIEGWRERLMTEGRPALTDFMTHYPHADSQHVRQLIRKAIAERDAQISQAPQVGSHKSQARKLLFRYLQHLIQASS